MSEYTPRLKWRKTWPDLENDFVADSPVGGTIGRFYVAIGGFQKGRWSWFYHADIRGLGSTGLNTNGIADTPREAAKAIEDNWFRAIEGKELDIAGKRYIDKPD